MTGEFAGVARFRGAVACARAPHGPIGLTLTGRSAGESGEELRVAFSGSAPAGLPERLEDAVVERGAAGEYRIASAARSWQIAARSVEVHREVAQRFYAAIPPRPAPWGRRALYRAMLTLARSRVAIALVRALRS
jgi:hypothetical protein